MIMMPATGFTRLAGRSFAGLFLVAPLLWGCEDSAARQQAAAQQVINRVATAYGDLHLTAGVADDPAELEKAVGQLTSYAGEVDRLTGASPGQQAAAAALAASMRADAARLQAARLTMLEGDQRGARSVAQSMIDVAVVLDAIARADESFDPRAEITQLDALRRQAQEELREIERRVANLDGPIAGVMAENAQRREQAAQLDQVARDLKRRAVDAGPADGFPFIEQAADKRREADRLRIQMAYGDIELAELEPKRDMATRSAEALRQLISTIESASKGLESTAADARAQASASRERVSTLRNALDDLLRAMQTVYADEMAPLYERTNAEFESAASLAARSSGGSSANAALLTAQIRQSQADLEWTRAAGLEGTAALLSRLINESALGQREMVRTMLDDVTAARTAALDRTKELLASAAESIGMAGGDSAAVAATLANIERTLAALSGQSVDTSSQGGSMSGGRAGTGVPAPMVASTGAESPEEILALFQSMEEGDPDGMRRVFPYLKASRNETRQLISAMRFLVDDLADLHASLRDTFGEEGLAEGAQATGQRIRPEHFKTASIVEQTANRATIGGPMLTGDDQVFLVRSGGKWFIDAESMFGNPDPQAQAMASMLGAYEQVRPMILAASEETAARVRAGEFPDAAAAMIAFQQLVQQKAMEMMRGALQGASPQ